MMTSITRQAPSARFDGFDEILAWLEGVDVAEHVRRAEPAFERLMQPPGVSGGVVASVADESTGHVVQGDSR